MITLLRIQHLTVNLSTIIRLALLLIYESKSYKRLTEGLTEGFDVDFSCQPVNLPNKKSR